MTSPEILPQSPGDKINAEMAEDLENSSIKGDAAGENQRMEVTEEEVCIYPAVKVEIDSDGMFGPRIRGFVARLIRPS